jgi:predicted transporter
MLALKVAQQGDSLQRTVLLQQGMKVGLPIGFKGIGHRAPVKYLAL